VCSGSDSEWTLGTKAFNEAKCFANATRVVTEQLVLDDAGDVGGSEGLSGVPTVRDVADNGCSGGVKLGCTRVSVAFGTNGCIDPSCESLSARGHWAGAFNVGVSVDQPRYEPAIGSRAVGRTSRSNVGNDAVVTDHNGVVREQAAFGPHTGGAKGLHACHRAGVVLAIGSPDVRVDWRHG
jgi:hypothetical protein